MAPPGVPRAIFAKAALSYIGVGVKPPTPSWRAMIQDGYQATFAFSRLILFPALAIGAITLAFTFVATGYAMRLIHARSGHASKRRYTTRYLALNLPYR